MAKKMRKILALVLVLTLCAAQLVMPANAWGNNYEWYEVYVQGNLVASGQGRTGNNLYLGRTYRASYAVNNAILTWSIVPNGGNSGSFSGTVDLTNYITIPEGFSVKDVEIETGSIEGVNSESNQYDNAIITITIKTLKNDETGEIIPVGTGVTVNHNYYTKDLYTGVTSQDGSTSSVFEATENDSFTATPVTTYNGNTYEQSGVTPSLTITVNADASQNVISIDYLRTIDTTPKQTSVAVNHNYYTKDLYTGETVLDGSASSVAEATENDSFTATPETTYGGNTYTQTTEDANLTITVVADASQNVINIDYLRTIDTTPADTTVTVKHNYYTKDLYTGETVMDGNLTDTQAAKERDVFTAALVTMYGDYTYTNITEASDLTITLVADASQNVVNIDYLRTIDTTPAKTNVTVNHNYYTKDLYTGETVLDGSTSDIEDATEHDIFTAVAAVDYNGNTYTQTTEAADLTITVVADASQNVINIDYLRTIDTTPVDYAPNLTVTKVADKTEYEVGDTIIWTITVTNNSDYVAYEVVVVDEMVNGYWLIDSLEPGGFRTFTATTEAEEAGTVKNVVVTTWTDGDDLSDAEETDEPKTSSDEETVTVTDPVPPTTQSTEPTEDNDIMVLNDDFYVGDDGLMEIEDEDVPLADVPQTGDISFLWIALGAASAGGAILLNRKREDD